MGGGEDKWTMAAELPSIGLSTPKRPEAPTASGMMMFSLCHTTPGMIPGRMTQFSIGHTTQYSLGQGSEKTRPKIIQIWVKELTFIRLVP